MRCGVLRCFTAQEEGLGPSRPVNRLGRVLGMGGWVYPRVQSCESIPDTQYAGGKRSSRA